jgi:hypothetical protein
LTLRIRHQRHISCEFDGVGNHALVLLAQAGSGRRRNLELARYKFAENIRFFVINVINFFLATNARHANFLNEASKLLAPLSC